MRTGAHRIVATEIHCLTNLRDGIWNCLARFTYQQVVEIEAAQLEKAGFVAAADEQLRASHGRQGFSLVMEFGGSAGARAAVAVLFKNAVLGQQGAKLEYFKVKGVAGTHGVTAVTRTVSTANVYWTEGRCTFGSGDYVPKRASAVSKPVIRGVLALQARTKGTCP